jgi:sulfite oxidase
MNGHPLTPHHGAPIRALFPGILGARSVKWLTNITVQLPESDNHYMQRDYKILPPEATDVLKAEKFWTCTPSMMDMPINSIIGAPEAGSRVVVDEEGCVEVRGYALPAGMDGPVVSVQVSGDGGISWVDAKLNFGGHEVVNGLNKIIESRRKVRWAWCLWTAKVKVEKGIGRVIVSKAIDFGGNTQPKDCQWNLRGVAYNAWGQADDLEVV